MADANPKEKPLVFIVDDDRFLLNMYTPKFEQVGFSVETATGALPALQRLRDGLRPAVILLDLIMPGVDGFSFLESLKKERLAPETSVVILSNQGQAEDLEKVKPYRVAGYIVKALMTPSEVVKEVEKAARIRGRREGEEGNIRGEK